MRRLELFFSTREGNHPLLFGGIEHSFPKMDVWQVFGWLVVIFLLLLLVLYVLGTHNHDYFSRRKLKFIRPTPLLGNMAPYAFQKVTFARLLADLYDGLKGCNIGGMFEFIHPRYLVLDPALIRTMFVKDADFFTDHEHPFTEHSEPVFGKSVFSLEEVSCELSFSTKEAMGLLYTNKLPVEQWCLNSKNTGDKWKNMRHILSPAYTSSKLKSMFSLLAECESQMMDHLKAPAHSTWAHSEHITHMTQSSPLVSSENLPSQNIHLTSLSVEGETPGGKSKSDVPEDTLSLSLLLDSSTFLSKLRRFFTSSFPFLIYEGSSAGSDPRSRPRLLPRPRPRRIPCCFFACLASTNLAFCTAILRKSVRVSPKKDASIARQYRTSSSSISLPKIVGLPLFVFAASSGVPYLMLDNLISVVFAQSDGRVRLEIRDLMSRFTNDTLATTSFGFQMNSFKKTHERYFENSRDLTRFHGIRNLIFLAFMFTPRFAKVRGTGYKKERYSSPVLPPALNTNIPQTRLSPYFSALSDDDIVAQALVFIFGGLETTSTVLTFACYELALHQDVQKRLAAEIDASLGVDGGKLTYETTQNIPYLDAVISETLRLYPPAAFVDRSCVKPYVIPASGDNPEVHLKKGDRLWVSVPGLHYDPDYFPEPDKFDPERFNEDNKDNITPFTFVPFGVGPRTCLGKRFAQMQMRMCLCGLLSRYTLQLEGPNPPTPLNFSKKMFTHYVEEGIWLVLEPRTTP
uniref:Cytochrome P450 n=1 Tax=Timema douglasi TaxID=61478 RepID=A0A7R8ZC18_TIMDO|nr:unnamed protein product [Timema douglasi]